MVKFLLSETKVKFKEMANRECELESGVLF